MRKYDFLIVGAGLFGAVFAREAMDRGKTCLVIDRRSHVGGNVYTEEREGIILHRYGAHIFHTADLAVWRYVNRFALFRKCRHAPLAEYHGKHYHLPFDLRTFRELWGVETPQEAKRILARQIVHPAAPPTDLEAQALLTVGREIYETFIKGYSEKQWGKPCRELPPFLLRRIPLRFTEGDGYFDDPFQGIPKGGYTPLVIRLLQGADLLLETDYFDFIRTRQDRFARILFSGEIDRFFDRRYGTLGYRSLRFETERYPVPHFQPCAVVNHTAIEVPYTRTIEHKYFEEKPLPYTFVTREYPLDYKEGRGAYYPINDEKNNALYDKYKALAESRKEVIFGGRLGSYAYLNMDQTIRAALDAAEKAFS